MDNSGKDALIAFVEKDDRKIRRRKTNYKPWEKRVILKERSPSSASKPTRRVLLRKVLNKPNRQLRPRIKMRKDEGFPSSHRLERDHQEPPLFAESAIIPTVAFLSKLAETTWQADPFRARRFIEMK